MFEKLSESEIFKGNSISLAKVVLRDGSGDTFERDVVRHVGAVSVVPLSQDRKRVVLLSQFRSSVGDYVLEIPAGKRDVEGESPETTALRELEEEVGLKSSLLVRLGTFFNSPGFTDEFSISYLGRGLALGVRSPQSPEERACSLVSVHLANVPNLISSGTICDAKTIIGLTLTMEYLRSRDEMRKKLFPFVHPADAAAQIEDPSDAPEVGDWWEMLEGVG